jgi:2Fe-2S ferredoxin
MVKIVYVSSSGKRREVEAKPGMTVMEAATKAGIDEIVAECGGACACATCQVYVTPEWIDKLPPLSPMEGDMLDFAVNPRPNSRLSCQIIISEALDGLTVETPADQG